MTRQGLSVRLQMESASHSTSTTRLWPGSSSLDRVVSLNTVSRSPFGPYFLLAAGEKQIVIGGDLYDYSGELDDSDKACGCGVAVRVDYPDFKY